MSTPQIVCFSLGIVSVLGVGGGFAIGSKDTNRALFIVIINAFVAGVAFWAALR